MRDKWRFPKPDPVRWAFYLHPQIRPTQDSSGWVLEVPGAGRLRFMVSPGFVLRSKSCLFSSSYGRAEPCYKLEGAAPATLSGEASWEFRVEESS